MALSGERTIEEGYKRNMKVKWEIKLRGKEIPKEDYIKMLEVTSFYVDSMTYDKKMTKEEVEHLKDSVTFMKTLAAIITGEKQEVSNGRKLMHE